MVVDSFLVYSFIRRLVKPFKDWKAFDLGIIDADGNILKKNKDLATREERAAFGNYDRLILNLKKALAKVPGGGTKLGSYAAALYLIKESEGELELLDTLNEDHFEYKLLEYIDVVEQLNEDAPTVSAGAGHVAGIGVGPDGEPPKPKKKKDKYSKVSRFLTRNGER
jgi:hypothetical protein